MELGPKNPTMYYMGSELKLHGGIVARALGTFSDSKDLQVCVRVRVG